MKSNGLLKLLSVLLFVAAIGMVVVEVQKTMSLESRDTPQDSASRIEAGAMATDPGRSEEIVPADSTVSGSMATPGEVSRSRLAVGVLGATPDRDQIHSIAEVPWLDSQANRAFNEAKDFACQLLPPDTPVKQPLTRSPAGRSGLMGRIPSATVGLEVDSASKLKLPRASRGAIEAYLRDHRLVIEPIVYQDSQGQAYFGTDCRAAFYQIAYPTLSIKAEGMIEEAVTRFRVLGVLREDTSSFGRTLVLAFRFVQQESEGSTSGAPQQVTELLFFHLAINESGNLPSIQVFATSDSRQNLHRLSKDLSIIDEPVPMISASIRFEKFILMGLYPANPIVTGVRQRAAAVMSRDTVLRSTKSGDLGDRVTFQQLLDQFSSITKEL
jgi:hypothetical protein